MAKAPMDFVKDAKSRIEEVDVDQAQSRQGASAVMLDVRDPNEFEKGHIPDAINVSRGMLEFLVEKAVQDKSADVVVYCGTGGRSALAADVMQQMGYSKVVSMAGGITAWKDQGKPIVQ